MLWPQRGPRVRLGGAELRSNAGRYALIAVCALIAYAGEYPRFANAEPSASGSGYVLANSITTIIRPRVPTLSTLTETRAPRSQ